MPDPRSKSGPAALPALERGARALRSLGLGAVVDRVGGAVGGTVARRQTVDVDGLRLRGSSAGHLWFLREVAQGREGLLAAAARAAVEPGRLAVDGGAQVGFLTLTMARAGARVRAYEPSAATLPALRGNVSRNGLEERVVVRPVALGAASGRIPLSEEGDNSTLARGAGPLVDVVALDDELSEEPCLVKLDLEGWEPEALRGMPRVLAGEAILLVECNPDALVAAGSSAGELVGAIRDSGREIWLLDEESGRVLPLDAPPTTGYANLLCARPAAGRRVTESIGGSR